MVYWAKRQSFQLAWPPGMMISCMSIPTWLHDLHVTEHLPGPLSGFIHPGKNRALACIDSMYTSV